MFDTLKKIACIHIDIHIWSGRKKLQPSDLNLQPGEIPPEDLASLGSKKVCDTEDLKVFLTLRRRAERLCESVGVRFLGGYAIPQEKAREVLDGLKDLRSEFYAERAAFIARYDESVQAWLGTIPSQWRTMVAQAIETPESVEGKLAFGHAIFQIQQVDGIADGLEPATLGERLLQEIAQAARDLWLESFKGRCKVSQKALSPLRAILDKAKSLTFLEGSLVPVIEGIEAELGSLPKRGYLEGHDLRVLIGILHTLAELGNFTNPVDLIDEPEDDLPNLPDNPAGSDPEAGQPVWPFAEAAQDHPQPSPSPVRDESDEIPLAAGSQTPPPSFWWV